MAYVRRLPIANAAFTLVELMVVVLVLSVLMTILLPTISMVKTSSRSLVCKGQLRELGIAARTYASDSRGDLRIEFTGKITWMDNLAPYIGSRKREDADVNVSDPMASIPAAERLLCCPEARQPMRSGDSPWPTHPEIGTVNRAWGNHTSPNTNTFRNHIGSYGLNQYLCWKKLIAFPRASETPMYVDSTWLMAAPNPQTDNPPNATNLIWGTYPNYPWTTGTVSATNPVLNAMQTFSINRHPGKTVNGVFLDGHVESIRLARLWELSWDSSTVPRTVTIP